MTFVQICGLTGYLLRRSIEVVVFILCAVVVSTFAVPCWLFSLLRKPSK